jgi:hypothetical protein
MSWKTYRVINNIYYVNKINKVLFMQLNDTIYEYDDTLELQFNKYKQDGNIDVYNGVVSIGNTSKIMIEINIFYKYSNAEFAPRFTLNIYKNNILLNTHYCGLNDNVETVNNLYLVSVLDVSNNDKIKINMIKDGFENSTSKINILKNSFINYKTF